MKPRSLSPYAHRFDIAPAVIAKNLDEGARTAERQDAVGCGWEAYMYLTYASTGGQLFVQAILTSVMGRCRWSVGHILLGPIALSSRGIAPLLSPFLNTSHTIPDSGVIRVRYVSPQKFSCCTSAGGILRFRCPRSSLVRPLDGPPQRS